MAKKYFIKQFPELRGEKARRRYRFAKHYEVKMRLKQMWYTKRRTPKHSH